MTDIGLQDALEADLKDFFQKNFVKMPWGGSNKTLQVYSQYLPFKQMKEGQSDGDDDTDDQWNYVCIALGTQALKDGKWLVEVHFYVGIKDWDEKRQGYRNVAHVMNEIFRHFSECSFVDGYYRMSREEAYKGFVDDVDPPYYEGDLITYWELAVPQETELEEFL